MNSPIKVLSYAVRSSLRLLKDLLGLCTLYLKDLIKYARFSSTFRSPLGNRHQLEARILAHYHVIEKGLSLSQPRPGFGEGVVRDLLGLLEAHRNSYPDEAEPFVIREAVTVLLRYVEFNKNQGINMQAIEDAITSLSKHRESGGTVNIVRERVQASAKGDFPSLAGSRHSTRHFSEEDVEISDIVRAIELAQSAPSVCNRQSTRVHIIADKRLAREALECQQGARGFAEQVNKVLVVTSTTRAFHGIHEHSQGFVDGGIFAMNLLLGLHYVGLGACPLGCYDSTSRAREIRRLAGIAVDERIVMLIAVGHLPEKLCVAQSRRLPTTQICRVVGGPSATEATP